MQPKNIMGVTCWSPESRLRRRAAHRKSTGDTGIVRHQRACVHGHSQSVHGRLPGEGRTSTETYTMGTVSMANVSIAGWGQGRGW